MAVIDRSIRQPGDFGFARVWELGEVDTLILRPLLRDDWARGDVNLSWAVEPGPQCNITVSYRFAPDPAGWVPSVIHGEITQPVADFEDAPFFQIRFQQAAGTATSRVSVTSAYQVERV